MDGTTNCLSIQSFSANQTIKYVLSSDKKAAVAA